MLEKINEINGKLKEILNELNIEKEELENSLKVVQQKIDSKIDEAKGYKVNVDEYKANISSLETEIASFEKDLEDLKNNYGNKGLDAIVDVGTKEINSKIISKQKEIAKQVERINELTDRARTIKELLINLKKDKKEKKEKFDYVSIALEYYNSEFEKIINYSEENPDALVFTPTESVEIEQEDVPVIEEPIDDSPVFDEIESIDKEENPDENNVNDKNDDLVKDAPENNIEDAPENNIEAKEDKKILEVNDDKENGSDTFDFDGSFFLDEEDFNDTDSDIKFNDIDIDDSKELNDENLIKEEDEEDAHFDDTISSLFATQKDNNIDFKTLNDSIDKEYENIFGKSINDEENITKQSDSKEDEKTLNLDDDHTGFTELDIFGDNRNKPSVTKTLVQNNNINLNTSTNTNTDIVTNFFITNKIDFDKFSDENKEYIRKIFNPINFTKVLEVLRKNSIELDGIYQNPKVFEMDSSELDSMITKLLIANQSIHNISLVLSSLPNITLMDLNEVISSFGTNIKDANITDIIIKAKHLSDMGKADR